MVAVLDGLVEGEASAAASSAKEDEELVFFGANVLIKGCGAAVETDCGGVDVMEDFLV